MIRYLLISVVGALVAGCAADFDDAGSAATVTPDTQEQTTTIHTFGGVLQRPGQPAEMLDQASERAENREINRYYRTVDGKQIELGGKFERSSE